MTRSSLYSGLLVAALGLLLAQVGEAAPAKKAAMKQRPAAKVVKKTETAKAAVAPTTAAPIDETAKIESAALESLEASPAPSMTMTPSTTSTETAAPAATSKLSTSEQIKPPKTRKIKAEIYAYNNSPGANRIGDGAVTSLNYVGLRYALSDTHSISFRQQYLVNYRHDGESTKVTTEDFFISSTKADVAQFLGDGTLTLTGRIFLPTGVASRKQTESKGSYYLRGIATKPISKRVSADYYVIGKWVNNSKDTYLADDGKVTANTDYAATHFGALTVKLGRKLSFTQALGTEHAWKRPIPGVGTTRAFTAYVDSGLEYEVVAGTTLNLGVEQHANILAPKEVYRLYRASDSQYYFALTAAI